MKILKGFTIQGHDQTTHVLKLLKNLYGQRQAGRVWNKHLHNNLLELGWKQSQADECVYYWKDVIFCVDVDDGVLASPNAEHLDEAINKLKVRFKITEER
jgi:Reverse transcriptase (RNA-dependent DNA polymerase)